MILDVTVEEVPPSNQPPSVPTISVVPVEGVAFEKFTLTPTGAIDPEGEQLESRWDLDGNPLSNWSGLHQLVTREIPAGIHNVTVTVRDPHGLTSNASVVLNIREPEEPDDDTPGGRSAVPSILAGLVLLGAVVALALYISRRPPS